MEPNALYLDPALKRLCWHSRRGMLELDLLLVPFANKRLATLSAEQLEQYRQFLAQEDQDMYTWLSRREPAPTALLQQVVELILAHNAALGSPGQALI